jgi:UDP-glucose 4-epimerase
VASVLVSGGCGFVGVPLVRRLLETDHEVVVIDDLSRGSAAAVRTAGAIPIIKADVRDGDVVRRVCLQHKVDLVVHLAALHFIPDCDSDPERCLSLNVVGTQSLLDAAFGSGSVAGIVLASTAAVYAPSLSPHEETSPIRPTDVYGLSKLAGEQLLARSSTLHGIPVGVARLFNVYGPGETNPHLIPAIVEQALAGSTLRLGNLSTRRDYVYTEDVARGIAALGDATLRGEGLTVNLGTGQSRSGQDVVDAVSAVLGRPLTVERSQSSMRASDRPALSASTALASKELGWEPTTGFLDGLRSVIDHPRQPA